MVIEGEWYPCDDAIVRPVVRGEVLARDGSPVRTLFLVDTGADRTVLDAATFVALGRHPLQAGERLGGVGGIAEAVIVETEVRLTDQGGRKVAFHGQFAALLAPEALDMCVLGRDVTALFAVVVDQPADRVCLVREPHQCRIELRDPL